MSATISISNDKEMFFIRTSAMGYRVLLRGWENWPLFADLRGGDWCLTEGSTGFLVATAKTRQAAIELARSRLRKVGKTKFARMVKAARFVTAHNSQKPANG